MDVSVFVGFHSFWSFGHRHKTTFILGDAIANREIKALSIELPDICKQQYCLEADKFITKWRSALGQEGKVISQRFSLKDLSYKTL